MPAPLHIVMVAAENDALRGGKVGGVGDVVRDLPRALAGLGCRVTVVVPSYGFLHRDNAGVARGTVSYPFAGSADTAAVFECAPRDPSPGVTNLVLHHAAIGGDPIYYDDPPEAPFARDAAKFARFSAAAGALCATFEGPYLLHCHDWHTGSLLWLRALHPGFAHLKAARTAFTIHNLSYQGTRPMFGAGSTLERWFPELARERRALEPWIDPRYAEPCFTPMAAAIRLADRVNTVSPRYASEILSPSDHARGVYGGEGLEGILAEARADGRLFGILNGIGYDDRRPDAPADVWGTADRSLALWDERRPDPLHRVMRARVAELAARPPGTLLVSISRMTDQKVRLLFERGTGGCTALERILGLLEGRDAVYAVQGSGTALLEARLAETAARSKRLLFLRGYSEELASALYRSGTMFLMPSSFEPCGIGQMLAMREGQPCVVHAVGGLRDTVCEGVNGFTFEGAGPAEASDAFVAAVARALDAERDPARWASLRAAAAAARFTWQRSAREYLASVYT
jgi:starch synthase